MIIQAIPAAEQDNTKKIIAGYAKASSGLAALAEIAAAAGVSGAGVLAKLLNKFSKTANEFSKESLASLNNRLREKLKLLNRPILIFVDDLDRLEPCEVVEVLRLVKAVADFPNVAYILAYDPEVIAISIQRALRMPNGKSYLEKVVQASFKVPNPMNFDLRNWLMEEVSMLLGDVPLASSARDRLNHASHFWCSEYLKTPRDVVRVINSMKLNFSPVQKQVDPGDMVFLQIIRTKNRKLFDWVERYVSDLSAIGDWGHISEGAHERAGKQLLEVIGLEGKEEQRFIYELSEYLPGLNTQSLVSKGDTFKVFSLRGADELQALAKERRLASPRHFRFYFSFSSPSGSLSDDEVEQFLSACEHMADKALTRFRQLIRTPRPQGGRLAQVLLDRIVPMKDDVSPLQVSGLFHVLGEAIDELVPVAKTDFGRASFLQGERSEIFGLIDRVEDSDMRIALLQDLFSEAKSLAWLTGIIRSSTFAHRIYGHEGEPKERWLLSEREFDMCAKVFLQRIRRAQPKKLLEVPDFLSLMYAWLQLGDAEGPRKWIRTQTQSDDEFISVLNVMSSWSHSSTDGVQYNLRPETLENFFESIIDVKKRLKRIVVEKAVEQDARRSARKHLSEIEQWRGASEESALLALEAPHSK